MSIMSQVRPDPGGPTPLFHSRSAVLAALAIIAVCFFFLGRGAAGPAPAPGQHQVKVVVSGERGWQGPTGSLSTLVSSAGRTLRVGIFSKIRLPGGVPAHLAGMILCTVLAGIVLMSSQFRFR